MTKKTFYTEIAYALGLSVLALGTALMEAADFGVSMVVAPAYLIYRWLSSIYPFFTFGMAEYTLQAFLLVGMTLVLRKFKISYLFSVITALIYGFLLDRAMTLVALVPLNHFATLVVFYILGLLLCSMGVSLLFHSYISPEAYELFVKEVSAQHNISIHKFKTYYDCISCMVGIALSFAFFGLWNFEGVKLGTIVCALINGFIIGRFTRLFETHYNFRDGLALRKYFAM
jgi:uncharacterized membrane protein YczE